MKANFKQNVIEKYNMISKDYGKGNLIFYMGSYEYGEFTFFGSWHTYIMKDNALCMNKDGFSKFILDIEKLTNSMGLFIKQHSYKENSYECQYVDKTWLDASYNERESMAFARLKFYGKELKDRNCVNYLNIKRGSFFIDRHKNFYQVVRRSGEFLYTKEVCKSNGYGNGYIVPIKDMFPNEKVYRHKIKNICGNVFTHIDGICADLWDIEKQPIDLANYTKDLWRNPAILETVSAISCNKCC